MIRIKELEYSKELDLNKKCSVWYGGWLMSYRIGNALIDILAIGDNRGTVYHKGQDYDYKDKADSGTLGILLESLGAQSDENLFFYDDAEEAYKKSLKDNHYHIAVNDSNWYGVTLKIDDVYYNDWTLVTLDEVLDISNVVEYLETVETYKKGD